MKTPRWFYSLGTTLTLALVVACSKAVAAIPPSSALTSNGVMKPYRLFAILDPDRDKMVMFACKVPTDWRTQQSFVRRWEGAVGQPQIFITLGAPDQRSQIVYFPSTQYLFSEGPMTENLRAQKRSFGMPTQAAPNELAPMPPVTYLRKVFLPMLVQNGIILRDLGNEQTAPQTRKENGLIEQRGSLDGTLTNGHRARVEVRLSHSSRQLGSDVWHSWSTVTSITQTAGDLEAIHTHTRMVQDSIAMNPAWLKLEQEAQARGSQANQEAGQRQHEATMAGIRANTAAMTRAHEQRMNDIRGFGEANTARFNERMALSDRDQRIRVDTIRGETKYADPATSDRVKVEDGFNHVYRSRQNPELYYGTQTPIDAGALDWQELQKVQLKDY